MDATTEYYLLIAVGTLVMFLLSVFLVYFFITYQRRLSAQRMEIKEMEILFQDKVIQASLESQEDERRRVAADLHDSVGAMLAAIRLGIGQMARSGASAESAADNKALLDETIESVRRISRDLMPTALERFGLITAIKEMCTRFQATTGIAFELNLPEEVPRLQPNSELSLFRVVQEIINNSLKHSGGSQLKISARVENQCLTMEVWDNGKGFYHDFSQINSQEKMGLGLFTIAGRMKLLGGRIWMSPEGHGAHYFLEIPYEKI